MKIKNKDKIKNILLITLSNIGDIILTTPVLSVLRKEFPQAKIDVLCGPNGKEIFFKHPFVAELIIYDKFSGAGYKRQLIKSLREKRYGLVVDLRNSLFPLLIGARYRTSLIRRPPQKIKHKKDAHLWKLKQIGLSVDDVPFTFYIEAKDEDFAGKLLADMKVEKDFVVVSPGAKSHIKRWTAEGFAAVCGRLTEKGMHVIIVGDGQDKKIAAQIIPLVKNKIIDLTSRLNLRQLGALIKRSRLVITNDSAPMHIACAVGTKVLAIFGPTDPAKYGPTGKYDIVIRKELACSPCEQAQCKKNHECMDLITAEDVFMAAQRMMSGI